MLSRASALQGTLWPGLLWAGLAFTREARAQERQLPPTATRLAQAQQTGPWAPDRGSLVSPKLGPGSHPAADSLLGSTRGFSRYERDVLQEVLRRHTGRIEAQPEGKAIERIEVVRLAPFDHRDPVPDFINVLHVMSRERVILRELLFREGEGYRQAKIDESSRALRAQGPLSLVVLLAVQGSAPDRVRVLVITKDVWTLVPAWNPQITSGSISMSAALVDTNLLGTHTALAFRGGFDARSYSIGGQFVDPRVFGSRIRSTLGMSAVFNRATGRAEGSYGVLSYYLPLWSLDTRWSWGTSVSWRNDVQRSYLAGRVRTQDVNAGPDQRAIPYEWDRNVLFGTYEVTRSWGHAHKVNLTGGVDLFRADYGLPHADGVSQRELEGFRRDNIPPDQQRLSPFLQLRTLRARYLRTWDFETLALEENCQLGYDLVLRMTAAAQAAGSSRDLLGTYAGAGYTVPLKDGILRGVIASRMEFAGPGKNDALLEGALRIASPRTALGRLVWDSQIAVRTHDYLKERFSLGGTNRLRGYPQGVARGRHLVAATLEFRSQWVGILGTQVGMAAFYDLGDAFDSANRMLLKQSVGAGVRIMLPQANRDVFRVDWGFPLEAGNDGFPGGISVSFYQAFPLPTAQSKRTPRALGLTDEGPPEPTE